MKKSVEQLVFEFTPIKTVAKFVQARWQVLGIQAMIGAADKCFGVGNDGVQPLQMIGVLCRIKLLRTVQVFG